MNTNQRTVAKSIDRGLAWTEWQGYQWVQRCLSEPLADELHAEKLPQRLRSHGEALLGDLALVHDAPLLACDHYHRAVVLWKKNQAATEDLGRAMELINRRRASKIELAMECLARGQVEESRAAVRNGRSVDAQRIRAMACGIEGDGGGVLFNWRKLRDRSDPLALSGADWFYLPSEVRDLPEFWDIVTSLVPRVLNIGLYSPSPDGSAKWFAPHHIVDRRQSERNWKKIYRLTVGYHLARTREDNRQIDRWIRTYPDWTDVKELRTFYSCHGRCPQWSELFP